MAVEKYIFFHQRIDQILYGMPHYMHLAKQLTELISSLQNNRVKIKEGEKWLIKGISYRVIKDIEGVNYVLEQKGSAKTVFLSELLPLNFEDFQKIE